MYALVLLDWHEQKKKERKERTHEKQYLPQNRTSGDCFARHMTNTHQRNFSMVFLCVHLECHCCQSFVSVVVCALFFLWFFFFSSRCGWLHPVMHVIVRKSSRRVASKARVKCFSPTFRPIVIVHCINNLCVASIILNNIIGSNLRFGCKQTNRKNVAIFRATKIKKKRRKAFHKLCA